MFAILFLSFGVYAIAQTKKYSDKDYARNPLWINMIKDTGTNYFEAEKAYKIYFQHHEIPAGEQEDIGAPPKKEKAPSKKEMKKLREKDLMRLEVKKYEHWHMKMKPFVQADGRILNPSERLKIWESLKTNK